MTEKTCGVWTVEVSEPSPAWIRIRRNDGQPAGDAGATAEEVGDLIWLLRWARTLAEAKERQARGHSSQGGRSSSA